MADPDQESSRLYLEVRCNDYSNNTYENDDEFENEDEDNDK